MKNKEREVIKMKLYGEFYEDEDYDLSIMKAVFFNKKRLIKVLNQDMQISNWKSFLREEYNSDDTDFIMGCFDDRGWSYKINSSDSWVECY